MPMQMHQSDNPLHTATHSGTKGTHHPTKHSILDLWKGGEFGLAAFCFGSEQKVRSLPFDKCPVWSVVTRLKKKAFFTAHPTPPSGSYTQAVISIMIAVLFLVILGLHKYPDIKALDIGSRRLVKGAVYVWYAVSKTLSLLCLFVCTQVDKHIGSDFFHQSFSPYHLSLPDSDSCSFIGAGRRAPSYCFGL